MLTLAQRRAEGIQNRSGIMPRPVSYDYNKRTGILSGAQRKREGESNLANQEQKSICREIGARTGGDIYIGVVGPVRSGKSTSPKGRGLGKEMNLVWTAKGSPFGRAGKSRGFG